MLQLIQPGRRLRALALSAVAAGPLMLAGCGGDDDGGGGPTASDEEYVANMCDSFNTFATDFLGEVMAAAFSGGSEEEISDAVTEAAKEVFEPLIDDLKSMGVPADVREYHDQMTQQMEDALKAIEDNGIEALDDESAFGEDIEFPAEIEERLQAVAEDTEECAELDLFSSET